MKSDEHIKNSSSKANQTIGQDRSGYRVELRRTCWTGVMLSDLVGLMDGGGTGASLELCTEYVGSGYLWNSDPDW